MVWNQIGADVLVDLKKSRIDPRQLTDVSYGFTKWHMGTMSRILKKNLLGSNNPFFVGIMPQQAPKALEVSHPCLFVREI